MERNLTIHGLRGLCALLVLCAHVYGMSVTGGVIKGETRLGAMGVNIFFMISGFVIPLGLMKYNNIRDFFVNRILRIYPVFLTLHLIVFLVGPIIGYEWLKNIGFVAYIKGFFSNLFLLPGIFKLPIAQKNAWSLSYEAVFYIIMSMLFLVNTKPIKNISRYILYGFWIVISGIIIYYHPRTLYFAAGVLGFYISYKQVKISKYLVYSNPFVFLVMLIFLKSNFYISLALSTLFFIPLVIEQGFMSKLLKTKWFKYYGDISYSLYLIHPFALYPFKMIFSKYSQYIIANNLQSVTILVFAIVGLIVSTGLSHLSYIYIEGWFTRRLKKYIYGGVYSVVADNGGDIKREATNAGL